jgi:hypothetical protein
MTEKNQDYNTFLDKLKKQDDNKFGNIFDSFALN